MLAELFGYYWREGDLIGGGLYIGRMRRGGTNHEWTGGEGGGKRVGRGWRGRREGGGKVGRGEGVCV